MKQVLELDRLSKRIGGVQITKDVCVRLRPGERRALLGPNGAGKTTLMNMAAGMLRPTSGRVRLGGEDVTRMPAHRRARRGLARTFQITNLFPAMTVAENLAIAVQSDNRRRWDPVRPWAGSAAVWKRVDALMDESGLGAIRNVRVGELGYGAQRRLEIVIAVARPSSVILLDEPGAGLTSDETEELLTLVFGLDPQLAVLFIDHDLDLALRMATDVTLLHLGEVVAEGKAAEVRRMPILQQVYQGVSAHA